jgi:hypothetical protein
MKKKTIIAFFCVTISVCSIYGGLRSTVSLGTSQVAMADIPEGENCMYDSDHRHDVTPPHHFELGQKKEHL